MLGRYVGREATRQILQPQGVIDELLATVFTVQRYVTLGLVVLGVATIAVTALVFSLSLRLRRREIETLHKIGGQRGAVWVICLFEISAVLAAAVTLAGILLLVTYFTGNAILKLLL